MNVSAMPSKGDATKAMHIMAELIAFEHANPELSEQHRNMLRGNYLITCILATDDPTPVNIKENFVNSLIGVGANREAAESKADKVTKCAVVRYCSSLKHIPPDVTGAGVKRSERGVLFDEAEFVQSIIELVS